MPGFYRVRHAVEAGGASISLTPSEFTLLDTLMAALDKQMYGKSDDIMELNRKALDRGAALID